MYCPNPSYLFSKMHPYTSPSASGICEIFYFILFYGNGEMGESERGNMGKGGVFNA